MKKALVWLEIQQGEIAPVAWEALGKAREMASPGGLQAVLIGADSAVPWAREAVYHGADEVFVAVATDLALYQSEAYSQIFARIAQYSSPEVIIIGGSMLGVDLASSVAALLGTGLTAHCVELTMESQSNGEPLLKQTVLGGGGNMLVTIICPEARPQMATIARGVFPPAKRDARHQGRIIDWEVKLPDKAWWRSRTIGIEPNEAGGAALRKAEIVVAGGFGMFAAGGFALIRELAEALGGAIAGTRAAFDQGWIKETQMIGQSGVTIAPKLLIVAGASGALHFTSGFKGAQTVVAIDKNPKAPIFTCADWGIVGDVAQIIPALLEEIKILNKNPR